MEQFNKKGFKTSVFLMLGLALSLIAFIFYIVGSNQKLFDSKYSLYLFLTKAEGLIPGNFVTLSGLKIGVVGSMEFTRIDDKQGILVDLKIDKDYADLITRSSVAEIKTMGILGDKYVDISLGKAIEDPLQPGGFLRNQPSIEMNAMLADAASSVKELNSLLSNMRVLSDQMLNTDGTVKKLISDEKMANDLSGMVHNLNNVSENLAGGKGNVGKMLQDSLLYTSLLNTSRRVDAMSDRISKGKGTVGQMLADSTFYPRLQLLLARSDSLISKLQGSGTIGKLVNDESLYKEFLSLTQELRALTEDIKKNPKKYGSFSIF